MSSKDNLTAVLYGIEDLRLVSEPYLLLLYCVNNNNNDEF